ncbi:MAG: nucleotidyltransferase domain-containing protein [Rhodocyclaceae bacterium]|jgi:predicted nucleotidyltransferase|nr:nucleotidyltransferase domain-containing protein [Rhodocyclaceae bacterium]MBK6906780.1 nucleotidyltransferase domain-containing protein [Rhodocyclaceae bacterium]
MRLSTSHQQIILDTVRKIAGAEASVVLFGSRTDDARRGGDIDLLIESPTPPDLLQKALIKNQLEALLQLPVDVIAKNSHAKPSPFQAIALHTGVRLTAPK